MIKIQRPADGPPSWTAAGTRQTERDCAAYDANPKAYRSGAAKFMWKKFRSEKKKAKDLLVEVHHFKCCYCETQLPSSGDLHLEHFRPKAEIRQTRDQKEADLPGYYWLAYSWDNLLLACRTCNSKFKRTFFPLANPGERARSHHDDVTKEHPLFVDPVSQDPRDHIRFDEDTPEWITLEGRTTIDWLELRRSNLSKERRKLLNSIRFYVDVALKTAHSDISELREVGREAREVIEDAQRPGAPFSSMVKDYVKGLGL